MKKLLLFIGILLFLNVQLKAFEPIRWGAVGGMNISKPANTNYSEGFGFHVGGKAEINLSNKESGFYITPMMLLSLKGGKPAPYISAGKEKVVNREHNYYLNVPVHLGYKHCFNQKIAFFGSVGPYMGLGLFGKFRNKVDGVTHSTDIYGNNGYLDRFDWGLGGQVGLEIIKKIQFSFGYELGLKNVAKTGDYMNRNFTMSCAYLF